MLLGSRDYSANLKGSLINMPAVMPVLGHVSRGERGGGYTHDESRGISLPFAVLAANLAHDPHGVQVMTNAILSKYLHATG